MEPAQIDKLIRVALEGAILDHWAYFGVLLAIVVVSTAAGAYVGAYLKSRAEAHARDVDAKRLLDQLKKTTETTESIKADIQHADWKAKESRTIRRQKLEEFFSAVLECHHWIRRYSEQLSGSGPIDVGPNPSFKVRMLGKLYFPEIDLTEFDRAFIGLRTSIHQTTERLIAARATGPEAHKAAWDHVMSTDALAFKPLSDATLMIERQSEELMKTLIG